MAELGGDSPPPLPGSPPPSEEDPPEDRVSSRAPSEKFRALQKMISSSPTMYSAKKPDYSVGAPPTKRQHREQLDAYEEPAAGESPKLTHRTLDRPKRKSRAPSRGKLRERVLQSQPDDPTAGAEVSTASDTEAESAPPGLPPPVPDSTPPEIPTAPPPSLSDALMDAKSELPNGVPAPPTQPQAVPDGATSLGQPYSQDGHHEVVPPSVLSPISKEYDKESTAQSPADREDTSIFSESTATPKMGTPSPITASKSTEAKKAAIGSFSERLKKIRENRTPKKSSPLAKTVSTSGLPSSESRPSLQTYASLVTASPSSDYSSSSSASKLSSGGRSKSTSHVISQSPTSILTQNSAAMKSQNKEQAPTRAAKSSSDVLPPVTPLVLSPDHKASTVGDTRAQSSGPPHSISSKTRSKKSDRMKKSRPVDSLRADSTVNQATVSETLQVVDPKTETDTIMPPAELTITASSESLPGLPECPPPDLPSSPPPDLADVVEAISETSLILDTAVPPGEASDDDTGKATVSPPMVTHRKKTFPTRREMVQVYPEAQSNVWRRSAFDALVTIEPSAEEKQEPSLSLKESRKLALEAARKPNADVRPILQRWSAHMSNSTELSPTHQEFTPEPVQEPSDDEKAVEGLPPPPPPPSTPPPSDSELQVDTDEEPRDVSSSPDPSLQEIKRIPSSSGIGIASKERRIPSSDPRDIFHTVKVISEGETIHSPDFKVTPVAKKRWRQSQPVFDDLQSSASTGDIAYQRPRFHSVGRRETSSLKSLNSSSESLSFEETQQFHKISTSPLLVSREKQQQSIESIPEQDATLAEGDTEKKLQRDKQRSSFLDSILADIPSIKQSDSYSSSSREALLGSPVKISSEEIDKLKQSSQDHSRTESKSPGSNTTPVVVERRKGRRGRRTLRNVDSLIVVSF